jgi:hypothetical protein
MLKMRLLTITLIISCFFGLNAGAASLTYNANIGLSGGDFFTPSDVGMFYKVNDTQLGNLSQFDPTLGTLNTATLTITGFSEFSVELEANVIDSDLDNSMDFEGGYTISANVPSTIQSAFASFTYDLHCSGTGEYPVNTGEYYPATVSILTAYVDDGGTIDNELASFIGNGDLEDITVGLFLWINSFTVVNLDDALVLMGDDFGYSNGSVSIEYDYTPVPIPGAIWLLGSGLLGLIGIRRRKQ